jgi:DNA-binding NarL/FixJ family response regulator
MVDLELYALKSGKSLECERQGEIEMDFYPEPLTKREYEVLLRLASDASNRQISRSLFITESTVKRHIYNIFTKLNVHNRTEAALWAHHLIFDPESTHV